MINTTYAKQEVDILQRILEQSEYSEKADEVRLTLSQFEGKHFRHLTSEILLQRVKEVSIKLRKAGLINNYFVGEYESLSLDLLLVFNIKDKVSSLERYKEQVENDLAKIELQNKLKKGGFCRLDPDTKSFHLTLPNGAVQTILLYTQRSHSDHMFLIFKVLYEHWLKFDEQVITKSKIKSSLDKLGWQDVNDEEIKKYIGNLRTKIIKPANLFSYINILSDRKLKGYKFKIIS